MACIKHLLALPARCSFWLPASFQAALQAAQQVTAIQSPAIQRLHSFLFALHNA